MHTCMHIKARSGISTVVVSHYALTFSLCVVPLTITHTYFVHSALLGRAHVHICFTVLLSFAFARREITLFVKCVILGCVFILLPV